MSVDRCVCCGRVIPEGGHVCLICRQPNIKQETYVAFAHGDREDQFAGTWKEVTSWADRMRQNADVKEIRICKNT